MRLFVRRDQAPDEHDDNRPAVAEIVGPLLDAAIDIIGTHNVSSEFWVGTMDGSIFSLVRVGWDKRVRFIPAAFNLPELPAGIPLVDDPDSLVATCGQLNQVSSLLESIVERFLVGRDAWEIHRS